MPQGALLKMLLKRLPQDLRRPFASCGGLCLLAIVQGRAAPRSIPRETVPLWPALNGRPQGVRRACASEARPCRHGGRGFPARFLRTPACPSEQARRPPGVLSRKKAAPFWDAAAVSCVEGSCGRNSLTGLRQRQPFAIFLTVASAFATGGIMMTIRVIIASVKM